MANSVGLPVLMVVTLYNFTTGLNGAGKTTILYRLKSGDTMYTIPTVGE